jgi:preprotein translocase subunit SecA
MRIFASDRVSGLMQKLGMEKGEAIEHPWVTKAIENAQRKVEAHNFDIRKNLLEFDDVANDQRKFVYNWRNDLMEADDVQDTIASMRSEVVNREIDQYIPPQSLEEQWDIEGLEKALEREFGLQLDIQEWLQTDDTMHEEPLRERILRELNKTHGEKESLVGSEAMRQIEKSILLQILDSQWKEHLAAIDYLRQGIHLRGYAQKNPKQEYKREAFEMFTVMLDRIHHEAIGFLAKVQFQPQQQPEPLADQSHYPDDSNMQFEHEDASALALEDDVITEQQQQVQKPFIRTERKVGRNELCPCGSGKKYKHCHGHLD